MPYRIYTTEGVVLGKKNVGEANQILHIFTRDLGLVRATVQGVRLEKAKLKNHVQLFSWAQCSFVRGKESWRLTSATLLSDLYPNTVDQRLMFRHAYADMTKLLRHFGVYDVAQNELYEKVRDVFLYAAKNSQPEKTLRLVVPLVILHTLGYLSHEDTVQSLGNTIDETFVNTKAHPAGIKKIIEKTLSQVTT